MSSVDFVVKLRDAAHMIADACEEYLEKLAPPEVKQADFDALCWEEKEGTKGKFQQTSEKAAQNSLLWQQLKAKLKENKGFWRHAGFKYWNDMQQETVIDRRKA